VGIVLWGRAASRRRHLEIIQGEVGRSCAVLLQCAIAAIAYWFTNRRRREELERDVGLPRPVAARAVPRAMALGRAGRRRQLDQLDVLHVRGDARLAAWATWIP